MFENTKLNKKTKLIVNAQPRSASNFLINQVVKNMRIKDIEIFHTHRPELFENKEYQQICIIRDPAESLISLCAMFKFFEKIPLSAPIDAEDIPGIHKFQVEKGNVKKQIKFLEDFLTSLNKNLNNVLLFSFEDVTKNTENVLKQISNKYNIEFKNNVDLDTKVYDNFSRQFLKSSKDLKHYSSIKDNISKYKKEIDNLYEIYNNCLKNRDKT